jgi:ABC-type multidrug transport system ATPase subunit
MIVFTQVNFSYDSQNVFNNLNCTLESGKNYIISGNNGSGKTTFLRLAAGLLTPQRGTVRYGNGRPQIGFVSHQSMCYRSLTVEENLRLFAGGDYYQAAELWKISRLFNKKAGALSRGEALRLSLALSGLNNPDLLILDEPTASLDAEGIETLAEELQKFTASNKDRMLIIATHEPQKFKLSSAKNIKIEGKSLYV